MPARKKTTEEKTEATSLGGGASTPEDRQNTGMADTANTQPSGDTAGQAATPSKRDRLRAIITGGAVQSTPTTARKTSKSTAYVPDGLVGDLADLLTAIPEDARDDAGFWVLRDDAESADDRRVFDNTDMPRTSVGTLQVLGSVKDRVKRAVARQIGVPVSRIITRTDAAPLATVTAEDGTVTEVPLPDKGERQYWFVGWSAKVETPAEDQVPTDAEDDAASQTEATG